MSEKPFPSQADWNEHLRSDWRVAHGIWPHVRVEVSGYTIAQIDAFFEGESAGKKQVDWARITSKPGTYPPSAHTLASHSSKAHDELSDAPADAHHAKLHAATHILSGADELDHDDLAGFASAEHLSLPNTMANVLSSYLLNDLSNTDIGAPEDGSLLQYWTSDSKWHDVVDLPPSAHASAHHVGGADLVNHDSLTGFEAAEHLSLPNTIANVLSDHNKAVHDSLDIDARYIDGVEVVAVAPSNNDVLTYDLGDTRWEAKTVPAGSLAGLTDTDIGAPESGELLEYSEVDSKWHNIAAPAPAAHASTHHVAGSDLVNHDSLTGFLAAEHVSLPNTIANVLSNHTKEVHDALDIDARYIDGKEVVAATPTDGYVLTYVLANTRWEDKPIGASISLADLSDTDIGAPESGELLEYSEVDSKWHNVSDLPPTAHTHVKADITDTPWAWADVSKTGSNLTDLATRQHAGLTNVTSDQHHAQLHASEHEVGGGDLVSHDDLTDFVGAEHLSLPNTIANVLSDHNVAVHNALDITELGTVSSGVWQGTAIANAYIAGINQDLLTTSSPAFVASTIRRYIQSANGVPTSNLGSPTVTEMALFDTQFNNKTEFYNINNLKFYTFDGQDWTEYTAFSDTNKRRFLGGDTSSGIFIPNLIEKFRVEITNSGAYVWLNALYMYWSSNSHNTQVHIWRRDYTTQVWSQLTSSAATVGAWPGHMYLPFPYIAFSPSAGKYDAIRIEFTPNWSGHPEYGDLNISLNRLQLWGGYPAGKRNIYSVDENKKVTFPGEFAIGTITAGATDYDKFLVSDGGLVKYRTGAQVLADIGASGSGHSHAHSAITDVTSDQHHAQLHASEHEVGGGDLISHDDLTDFVAAEHVNLPANISAVLSNHNLTIHNALAITTLGTVDTGIWQGTAIAWTYVSKTGSNLTDLITRQHAGLTNVTSDQHHAQLHAASHADGQGDELSHDALKDFVGAEHLSLPNTIAAVLSDHDKAAHDALGIDANTVDGEEAAAIVTDARVKAHFPDTIANILSNHTKAVHDALDIDARYIDGIEVVAVAPSNNEVLTYVLAETRWEAKPPGIPGDHAAEHEVGGGDLVSHDDLDGFLAAEHVSLPNSMANVINSGHTAALHEALSIAHSSLSGVSVDQHHTEDHTLASHTTRPHSALSDAPADAHHAQSHTLTSHSTRAHSELTGISADQHHAQSHTLVSHTARDHHNLIGLGDDDHTQYYNSARHTKAIHDALDIDARYIDGKEVVAPTPTDGYVLMYDSGDGRWEDKPIGGSVSLADLSDTNIGGLENGDLLEYWTSDSKWHNVVRFPDTIANILSDHTLAVHNALAIDHGSLSGRTHDDHSQYLLASGARALTGNWDAGSYQIRALKFYSDQATGVAPFTVLSTTKVANLNADYLRGYAPSSAAGNNTIVLRTASGYIYCNYLNCTSGPTTSEPTHYFVETGNDSFLRQMTPANFVAKLAADGLMPKAGGTFTGHAYARDHPTGLTDAIINVCYGTGSPPAANTTTIGTLFVKYTA